MCHLRKFLTGVFASWACAASAIACPLVGKLVDYNCDGRHRISVTGDSFVFGTGDELNGGQGGYVLRLQRAFASSEAFNFGYPGLRTPNLFAYYKKLFAKKRDNEQINQLGTSDIVIIDIGRNDYYKGGHSANTANTIKRLTVLLRTELEKRFGTSPLFVTTVLPLTKREFDAGYIKQVNMVLLKTRGRDLPAYLRFDKVPTTLLSPDGLHPSSAGYDLMGQIASAYIRDDAQTRSKASRADADHDGIYDLFERLNYKTAPGKADTDGDGLKDGAEVFTYDTDPLNPDTDGDGIDDGTEVAEGTDPKGPGNALPTPTPTPTATPGLSVIPTATATPVL